MLDRETEPRIINEVKNQKDVDGNMAFVEHLLHFQQNKAFHNYARTVRV